jgi:asparagine synthase (glutamine-hydrolysing)
MSGIAAVLERNGPPPPGLLGAIASSMAAIGPDRTDVRVVGTTGLVHCLRGDLTPEDAYDAQPARSPNGRFTGVFDGRIDNRDDLRRAFGITGAEVARTPDSTLFLRAWERWGTDACTRVVGPCAAIVLDERTGELVAVRDPLGERVLYHHTSAGRVVVASTPTAIHATGVPRRLDEVKVADSLILNYRDATRTFFEGITRVPAGHRLHVTATGVRLHRYYDIADLEPLHLATDDDYVDAARDVLDAAIRSMLRTTAPPSLCLSSGLDSTMVAVGLLPVLRERGESLHAYTSVPLDRWRPSPRAARNGDESPGVDAFLAMHPEIDHTYVQAGGRGLFDYLDSTIDAADAPPRNAMNLFWIHEIHRRTRERGARVVLTGGGGNLTLGWDGRTLPVDLLRAGRLGACARELAGTTNGRWPGLRPLLGEVVLPYAPRPVWAACQRLRKAEVTTWSTFSAIDPGFAEAMDVDGRADRFGFDAGYRPPRGRAEFQRALLGNAHQELADVHRAFGVVHGTEVRDPTFDRRVVELAFRIPPEQYRRNGRRRWLQKRLLAGQAPPEVLTGAPGRQAADARLRVGADVDRVRSDVDEVAADPQIRRMFDVDRLRSSLEPEHWWTADQDPDDRGHTLLWLSRAVATARFVQSVRDPLRARIPVVETARAEDTVPVELRSAADERRWAAR